MTMFNYIEYKENQNLIPVSLNGKEDYFRDLNNIEYSWTGRSDAMFSNQFFHEAVQLILNSIILFEKGYFDCAFYSLRQSLEISTTSIYFVDDNDENRNSELRKWARQEQFPLHNQMINQLQNRRSVFANIKDEMSSYFEGLETVKRRLNKYVHKQGFDKFYTYRNRSEKFEERQEKMVKDFEQYLIKSIGAIAIFRLVVDPVPLLLLDEEIYFRTGDLITECYSENFISKYIGEENINLYKKTEIYKGYYETIMQNERLLPSVANLVKDGFIDKDKSEELLTQKHLLQYDDLVAICLATFSDKVVKIYSSKGFASYFTSIKSERKNMSFSSQDFDIFDKQPILFNSEYYEVFLSSIKIRGLTYQMEHNIKFNDEEITLFEFLMSQTNT